MGLIGSDFNNEEALRSYSNSLMVLVIEKVLPLPPITLRKFDDCIVKCRRLFDAVLFDDSIPISDIPPCILTEMLNHTDDRISRFWKKKLRIS